MSVNCNEELVILALACNAPLVIPPKTPIVIAFLLPMNTPKQNNFPKNSIMSVPFDISGPEVFWVQCLDRNQPKLTCSLTHHGKTIYITGMLDTGADATVISHMFWPSDWDLVAPADSLTGIGGATVCLQSAPMINITGSEGMTVTVCPFVVQKPLTVWRIDVLSQWGTKLEVGL